MQQQQQQQQIKSLQNDEDVVALMLIRERALGAKSSWAPYIKTLPVSEIYRERRRGLEEDGEKKCMNA
jgi:hypothetical protein